MLRPDQIDQLKDIRTTAHNAMTDAVKLAGQLGELALEVMEEQTTYVVPERAALEDIIPPNLDGLRWYSVEISHRERNLSTAFLQLSMNPEGSRPILLSEMALPASSDVNRSELKSANPGGLYVVDWFGQKRGLTYPLQGSQFEFDYRMATHRAAGWILSTAGTIHL